MPKPASPAPAALFREAARLLAAAADPVAARRIRAYFKSSDDFRALGVKTPRLREIVAGLRERVRRTWRLEQAVAFADLCLARRELEVRAAGILILGRFSRQYEPGLLARVKRWAAAGRLDNWASLDVTAGRVVTPLLTRFPALVPELTSWSASRSLWVRRMSVVPLTALARRGRRLDDAYRVVESLLGDREDLMHKATGWLLREAGKTDPARLEAFLLRHGPAIPRTTLRYAIERFPPAHRERLLVATRKAARRRATIPL